MKKTFSIFVGIIMGLSASVHAFEGNRKVLEAEFSRCGGFFGDQNQIKNQLNAQLAYQALSFCEGRAVKRTSDYTYSHETREIDECEAFQITYKASAEFTCTPSVNDMQTYFCSNR